MCQNLKKLPSSIGQLKALQDLDLDGCGRLEALPESISALSTLQQLGLFECSSISKPIAFGHMTHLTTRIYMDLASEEHAFALAQLKAPIIGIYVAHCNDEAISVLDRLGALYNLRHLPVFAFWLSPSMTKLP